MRTIAALVSLITVGCAQSVDFVGAAGPVQTVTGNLYRPEGTGPSPAMVLLHTCAGPRPHVSDWATWLKAEGYVALAVDSFSPRHVVSRCDGPGEPTVGQVAGDAGGALAYLHSLPFVDGDRVGVMGWSYGAMAALTVASGYPMREPQAATFRLAVGFYPHCGYFMSRPTMPVLLLLGAADDETPPALCEDRAKDFVQDGRTVVWKVYPGATHAFDMAELGGGTRIIRGYTYRYDPAARADAMVQVRTFLAQYLR